MAEIGRTRQGQLLQGVMQILQEKPDGQQAAAVISELEERLPPTPFEDEDYPKNPGVRRYPKIVRFSTIGSVKAGWINKAKGVWTLTPEGAKALADFTDPTELIKEASKRYRAWKKAQPNGDGSDGGGDADDVTPAISALEEAEEVAWQEIADYLGVINPYDFQELVATLLRAMGYFVTYVAPPGPDQGLDILAFTDALGATGPRIKVQVKRKGDKTGAEGVRSFMALLSQQDVGLFISTGGFTADAMREARGQEVRRISLIDAQGLFDLWVEHYDSISDADRQLLPLKPVYFLAPPP